MIDYVLVSSIIVLDLILGLIVYFKGRRNKTNRAFFWLTFFVMIWIASNFLENEIILQDYASLLLKIDFASAILLAYFFLSFCLNFPKSLDFSLKKKIGLVLLPLIFSILSFFSLVIKNFSFYDSTIQFERGMLYWFYALILIAYIGFGSLNLVFKLKRSYGIERIQTIYILIGLVLSAIVAISVNLILTQILIVPTQIYRIGIYGILFFVIFTTYAIIKHHLMNIKVIATEFLVGLVSLILLIDLLLSDSFPVAILKTVILVIFVYLGISLIRSVLKEIRYREEIKKAYEVEKRARKDLERLGRAKSQFIMATQHHLRTPLTSMVGYVDLILTGTYGRVPAKLKNIIFKFNISTKRLIRIVNELLDISQFQLGKKVVSLQPNVRIEPILDELMEELKFEAEHKSIYLKLKKPKKILKIKADSEKLKVALFNIVDNAIKYTRKGGVTINIESDRKLRIVVKDTGMGIAKEGLKTLFQRTFERGKEAKEVFATGRGIGLYITYQIIKAHNGKIWAESEGEGKGSTFYIELPVR